MAVLFGLELMLLSLGTIERNRVWRNEETLWRDVTVKSPRNGRGLMNYGSILVEKGEAPQGLLYIERARELAPDYGLIELNLGFALGKVGRDQEAEEHFRKALVVAAQDPRSYYVYAQWLDQRGREREAIDQLRAAVKVAPDFLDSLYLLMKIEARRGKWEIVARLGDYLLNRFPSDPNAKAYLLMAADKGGQPSPAESMKTAESYLNLSVLYYQVSDFERSISAASEAIKRRPAYAEAYNNIAAAYLRLERWDEAIRASREALRIRPAYRIAERNLGLAQAERDRKSR
jgi:tetratricopeptide (TPR) repeat protein